MRRPLRSAHRVVPGFRDSRLPYTRPVAEVCEWDECATESGVGSAEVARRVHPMFLIGTSTEHGVFPETIVRYMPLPELSPTAPRGRAGSRAELVV
ncbi:malic enzyme-like NAD(P)-binding protein [Nocardia sp. NPDC051463]|uniref:malic enzyme-like NAD(P)-binding protein n=1 Tax=Nocardia sp. NPDC051463 TaxID=3154845 RepID=UPI00344B0B06